MLIKEKYYDFSDVLIKANVSNVNSRSAVDLKFKSYSKKEVLKDWRPIPVMSANMDTITDIEMAFELVKNNWIAVLHKYVSISDMKILFDKVDLFNKKNDFKIDYRNIFISRGTTETDKSKLKERLESEPRIKSVCIDVANGHRLDMFDYLKELKNGLCKDKILMAGNVGTEEVVKFYIEAGVDIIKAGIGPGSACITRVKTGVGIPQISLIDKLKTAVMELNGDILIASDGGCKTEGDIAKAFVAGTDFVMIGGMLAGYKESPGVIEIIEDKKYKRFSGMAAKESQHNGVPKHGTEEGKTVLVPYKGKVYHKLLDIEGGLRSAATYIGANNINEMYELGILILTNVQENKIFNKH